MAAATVLALTATLAAGCGGNDNQRTDAEADASTAAAASATLVQKGLDELAAGDTAAAKATFENVVALDPDNVYGNFNLGVIAQQAGDDPSAMAAYDVALATDDAFAPALYNKAILTESSDLEAAVALYRRAVEADPTMAAAFMRLGFALVHLGQEGRGRGRSSARASRSTPRWPTVEAPSYG